MNELFRKIPQKKVSDRVFDQIRAVIISGRLAPGDRLPPERELTGLLEVSRSSVREAILKLECLGFVEQRHGEGTFVRSVTETPLTGFLKELIRQDDFMDDLMEVRAVLAAWGAEAAAAHARADEIAAMEACLEDLRRSGKTARINNELYLRLHFLISSASRNRFLVHIMNTIASWINGMTCRLYADTDDENVQARLLTQHAAIVAAIRSGRGEDARRAMAAHLRYTEETAQSVGKIKMSSETAPHE
jgi:GntR family transcriptional repressor for pyruvate dehydrogenase complex